MKKLIPLLSLLALCLYGCNDHKDQAAGFERQEEDIHSTNQPGFEKQNQQYKMDDANITTPIDSRPDLEEED